MKTIIIKDFEVLIDDEDYEKVSKYKWSISKGHNTYYAKKNNRVGDIENNKYFRMHSLIMQPPKGMVVDHIDGNGLNNTRINLRICNFSQNSINKNKRKSNISGYKCIFWDKINKNWRSQFRFENKKYNVGSFENINEAIAAYNKKVKEICGEFAVLN